MRHPKHPPSTSVPDLKLPVECWLDILNWSIEPEKCDPIAIERRPRRAARLVTPRSSHREAEKRRRELRLVCRSWKAEMDRLAGRWGVMTDISATTPATVGKLRMVRFDQSQEWQGTEGELLWMILAITKNSVELVVLEVVLCPEMVARLFQEVASWDHAVCLQSLSLTITNNAISQSPGPQNAIPLRLLSTISSAFPSLVELVIDDKIPTHEDTTGLASFSMLILLRLQSFVFHLPRMAINWDQIYWDLPSLLHLSIHIGCYVTPEFTFSSFASGLLSLSLIRDFGEPIYLGKFFWETFESLQQIEIGTPYVRGSVLDGVPSWHPVRTLIVCHRPWPARSNHSNKQQASTIFSNIALFVDRDSPIDTVICRISEGVLDGRETTRDYIRGLLKETGWKSSSEDFKRLLEKVVDEEGVSLHRGGFWGLISAW
jgi:hypothetical protein